MKNLFDIKDKVVVITGGTGVLGKAIAFHLAEEGAKVVVLGRKAETGDAIAREIKANGGEAMFLTTPGIAASGATNFRIMFSTYVLQGSFMIAVTLFQSLGKAKKATWLVLFRQIILFIPLCVVLPMIGGMGIRGVWLAIALTDAILVVITVSMMLYEFGKLPETSSVNR